MAVRGCYRYYSTQRPLSLGTYPKPQGNKVLTMAAALQQTWFTVALKHRIEIRKGLENHDK